MTHDRALTAALAGGPIPAEVVLHLRECEACREELKSLRELEGRLRGAALTDVDPAWEARVARRLSLSSRDRGRIALRAAAALLLVGALAAGLFSATGVRRSLNAGTELAVVSGTQTPSPTDLRGLLSAPEDSTAALLDLSGQVSEEMPLAPPTSLLDYFGNADSGGWNG